MLVPCSDRKVPVMLVTLLKGKLHRVRVTDASLHYEGSLGVDENLLDAAGLLPNERVLVGNVTNGERFETYLIAAPRGSGAIVLNGAVARQGAVGDILTLMIFAQFTPEEARIWQPRVVHVDAQNQALPKS